jgi:hypothetical protein
MMAVCSSLVHPIRVVQDLHKVSSSLLKKPSVAFSTSSFERRFRASVSIVGEFSSLEHSARNNSLHGIWTSCPATRFSNDSHFQWLTATENGGTSMYRAQPVEKQGFSTGC